MNIKKISEETKLPYSTTRKYLTLLEDAKLLESKQKDGSRVFPNDAVRYVRRMAQMSRDGVSLPDAIEKIRIAPYVISDNPEVAGLERRIEELRRTVQSLTDAFIASQQKALPEKSGQGFWYHFKAAFSSLWSGLRRKNTPEG